MTWAGRLGLIPHSEGEGGTLWEQTQKWKNTRYCVGWNPMSRRRFPKGEVGWSQTVGGPAGQGELRRSF